MFSAFRKVSAGFTQRQAEAPSGSSKSRAALQEGTSCRLRVTPAQAMPLLTREAAAVLQHLVGGGIEQDASNWFYADHPRQGELTNQVLQHPSREPSQERQEMELKTRLHHRSKVHPGGRAG